MPHLIEAFVTATGLLMSLSYYPQAWRMYRMKSAATISVPTYTILAFGNTVWTAYGFYLHSEAIVASFLFGAVGAWLILWLIWLYRNAQS